MLKYNEWKISEPTPDVFYATDGRYTIHFEAGYRNGLYSKVIRYYDTLRKRQYSAQRFLYKFIRPVSDIAFILLKNGRLWDYENCCPALKTYKKDMEPYYNKCLKKGLSVEPWLKSLYE